MGPYTNERTIALPLMREDSDDPRMSGANTLIGSGTPAPDTSVPAPQRYTLYQVPMSLWELMRGTAAAPGQVIHIVEKTISYLLYVCSTRQQAKQFS